MRRKLRVASKVSKVFGVFFTQSASKLEIIRVQFWGRRTEWEKTIAREMQCAGTHMVCRLGLNETFCVALVSDLFLEYCTSCPLTHSVVGKHLPGLYFRFQYTHSLSLVEGKLEFLNKLIEMLIDVFYCCVVITIVVVFNNLNAPLSLYAGHVSSLLKHCP